MIELSDVWGKVCDGDVEGARDLLTRYPKFLHCYTASQTLLHDAAEQDNVDMLEMLVELGLDVNVPDQRNFKFGPIDNAASDGNMNVARWLLKHGAKTTSEVNGKRHSVLGSPIMQGNVEMVKLLVEHGADLNADCNGSGATPLGLAMGWAESLSAKTEHEEIAAYLRSKGATERWVDDETPDCESSTIVEHIQRYWAKPKLLPVQEKTPGDPTIKIHLVHAVPSLDREYLVLFTEGMSDKPMTVPKTGTSYKYAELLIYLPGNWPLTKKALKDPINSWPIDWLYKLARWPHENKTWLGGEYTIITNGDPPRPLAPNVKFTSIMVHAKSGDAGALLLPDKRPVVFYFLTPLYTEEFALEKEKGIEELLRRFHEIRDDATIDVNRPNVALGGKSGKPPSAAKTSRGKKNAKGK